MLWRSQQDWFPLKSCPHWASNNLSEFSFLYPGTGYHGGFHSWASVLVNPDSLYLLVSNLAGYCLSFALSSLMDTRINITVCSPFYLLAKSDFHTPHMQNCLCLLITTLWSRWHNLTTAPRVSGDFSPEPCSSH